MLERLPSPTSEASAWLNQRGRHHLLPDEGQHRGRQQRALLATFYTEDGKQGLGVTVDEVSQTLKAPVYRLTPTSADLLSGANVVAGSSGWQVNGGNVVANIPSSLAFSGDTDLSVAGKTATLSGGALGSRAYFQVKELPQTVTEIVLQNVPGSIDDYTNMQTGELIHQRGYRIVVPGDSEIASGAVDLLASAKLRTIEPGAKVWVHSWGGPMQGRNYPCDHQAHHAQLCFFTNVMGAPAGPRFYWYTLNAAPFNGIHFMTEAELVEYGLKQ